MHHDDTTPDTIPYGYCHCGCGQRTKISPRTDTTWGYVRGEPRRYMVGHNTRLPLIHHEPGAMKRCTKCGQLLSVDMFFADITRRDGLSHRCKQCRIAMVDEWRRRRPDKVSAYALRRNASKRAGGGQVSTDEWQAMLDRFSGRCAKCGSSENIHMDHVVPLSRGGAHSIDNVQPLCQTCNLRKHTKTEDYRGKFYKLVALPLDDTA